MITVSTASLAEAGTVADLLRTAPAWLDWRVYRLGSLVASSAEQARTEPQGQDAR